MRALTVCFRPAIVGCLALLSLAFLVRNRKVYNFHTVTLSDVNGLDMDRST